MKKLVLFLFLATVSFVALNTYFNQRPMHFSVVEICDLVKSHHYNQGPMLEKWARSCYRFAQNVEASTPFDELLGSVNLLLDDLRSSHLAVYSPQEDEEIWNAKFTAHGAQFFRIGERVFVERVLPNSPASHFEVQFGDEVLEVNSQTNLKEIDLENSEGWFKFSRKGKNILINLMKTEFTTDDSPKLIQKNSYSILDVPSFRKEHFEEPSFRELSQKLSRLKKPLVVDLRYNQGGNFVAMLRLLSLFECDPKLVGTLKTANALHSKIIQDDLRDEILIEDVKRLSFIYLKTFPGYGCVKVPVTVLVGKNTMSVAEIFAESIREKAKLLGANTAGKVVVGVWYTLASWPEGFTASVPQAQFTTASGKALESIGVKPDENVIVDVDHLEKGLDPWIEKAIKDF